MILNARLLPGAAALWTCILVQSVKAAVILQGAGSPYVSWEGETEATIINGTPAYWTNITDSASSGGAALYIAGTTDNPTAPHSFIQYAIRFSTPGTYNLYYRYRADPARTVADQFTGNSALIPNALGAFQTAGTAGAGDFHTAASNGSQAPANNVYDWQREADTSSYTVSAEQVAAGIPLILTIGTREAGFTVDRWVLSPDPALSDAALDALVNSDTSLVVQGSSDDYVSFEAEFKPTFINGSPAFWTNVVDAGASGTAALYIGGTTDNPTAPHSFAQYKIKFSKAGTYNLYYRYRADAARTVADQFTANSTLIPNALGDFHTPGTAGAADFHTAASNGSQAPANNVYDWQREADTATYTVTAEQVAAGIPLIFSVGTREAGFTVDRWVFSPDPALTDAALDALPNSGAKVVGPELVKAVGSSALNTVRVFFTRPLNVASATKDRFTIQGLTVNSATVDVEDPRQVLLSTSAQTEGTSYTVNVAGVTDTSGNAIAANSKINFTAWKQVQGWATTEIYLNQTGTTLDDIKNSPAVLARNPDEVRWVKGFQLNNAPRSPNMAAILTASFIPPQSGTYDLFLNNDDDAELLISNTQSEAGLQSLGTFPLNTAFDDNISATTPSLTANTKYLLQGIVRNGGGDVYLNVGAKRTGAPTPPVSSLPVLSGAQISTFVNPDLGNVTFTQQPANATANAGSRARFLVQVKANEQPIYYQWQVNNQDIPGATRPEYITPVLTTADSGKSYKAIVSVAGKDTASSAATLTVNPGEPSNLQPYVGINFVGGGDNLPGRLTPVDVAGVAPQENWNNLTGFDFTEAALVDASGTASPVTLSATATEHWYSGTLGAGDANGVLLQGFLSTGASMDPFVITLNHVPSGTYNVVVYSIGFPFQAAYEEDVSLTGGGTYPTYKVKAESGLEYNANPQLRRMQSTSESSRASGNYVQFDNVTPAADGSIAISTTWTSQAAGNTHQPAVNGIQLIKVNPITVKPSLAVTKAGNNLVLTWDAAATGFTLETTQNITANSTWSAAAGAANPLTGAGTLNVNTTSGARAFYRLKK